MDAAEIFRKQSEMSRTPYGKDDLADLLRENTIALYEIASKLEYLRQAYIEKRRGVK